MIPVIFSIKQKDVAHDETVAILGSDKSLGRWNLQEPVYCQKVGSKTWEARVTLTPGTTVYWCCILVDVKGRLVRRETCPRRRSFRIDEECTRLEVTCGWNQAMDISQVKERDKTPPVKEELDQRCSEGSRIFNVDEKISILSNKASLGSLRDRTEILVAFRIKHDLKEGEDCLSIIGSQRSLGNWRVDHAASGQYMENKVWEVVVRLTAGTTLFWSCVTLDDQGSLVRREAVPRRRVLAIPEESPALRIAGAWDTGTVVINNEDQKEAGNPQLTRTSFTGACWSVLRNFCSSRNRFDRSRLGMSNASSEGNKMRPTRTGRVLGEVSSDTTIARVASGRPPVRRKPGNPAMAKTKTIQQEPTSPSETCDTGTRNSEVDNGSSSSILTGIMKFMAHTEQMNLF